MREDMHLTSLRTYYSAMRVARRIFQRESSGVLRRDYRYTKNVHPLWDCQPWSEGMYSNMSGFRLVHRNSDEMTDVFMVRKQAINAALWNMNPGAFKFPKRA